MQEIKVIEGKETSILGNHTPRSWERKENIETIVAVAYDPSKPEGLRFRRPVVARFYMGRSSSASVVYCSLTVSNEAFHTHGHGSAGGYGYDKTSAALDEAIRSANIQLSASIHGTGRTAEAIRAIAQWLHPELDVDVIG